MADAITVDELKIFVGSKLSIEDVRNNHKFKLYGVSDGEFAILTPLIDRCPLPQIGKIFKPMVRPLLKLTDEEMVAAEFIKPNPGDSIDWDFLKSVYTSIIHSTGGTYKSMMWLASKHYDIFNWLNKTGEDGQPLAVEL